MKAWVLTREINRYDQDGEYFVAWWPYKPSMDELQTVGLDADESAWCVIGGGGRRQYEAEWYYLREVDAGKR